MSEFFVFAERFRPNPQVARNTPKQGNQPNRPGYPPLPSLEIQFIPSMDPPSSLEGTSKFSKIFEPLSGSIHHFQIIQSIAPLTILELFLLHLETLPRLKGPSWTPK